MANRKPTVKEALKLANIETETPRTAEESYMARGEFAAFFARNKEGIQYVNYETRTYFISRSWTLRGPIPKGVRIEHTGLAGPTHSKPLKGRR